MQQHGKFKLQIINTGPHKLNVVKAVKDLTGLSLKWCKDAVEGDGIIAYGMSVEDLTNMADCLREVGASVEITPTYTNEHVGI